MSKVTIENLRVASHWVAYLGITLFFITRALQSYLWLEKNELGTIYKVDVPGHVTYPAVTFCPIVDKWKADEVNETWIVPKPSLKALINIKQTYFKDKKYYIIVKQL